MMDAAQVREKIAEIRKQLTGRLHGSVVDEPDIRLLCDQLSALVEEREQREKEAAVTRELLSQYEGTLRGALAVIESAPAGQRETGLSAGDQATIEVFEQRHKERRSGGFSHTDPIEHCPSFDCALLMVVRRLTVASVPPLSSAERKRVEHLRALTEEWTTSRDDVRWLCDKLLGNETEESR